MATWTLKLGIIPGTLFTLAKATRESVEQKNGQSGCRDFFFLISFFYKLECTRGNVKKQFRKKEKMKKKVQVGLLNPPGRYTRINFLFKGGLSAKTHVVHKFP